MTGIGLWIVAVGVAPLFVLGGCALLASTMVGRGMLARLREEHVEWWFEHGQPWLGYSVRPYRTPRETELSQSSHAVRLPTPVRFFLPRFAFGLPVELAADAELGRLWSRWCPLFWIGSVSLTLVVVAVSGALVYLLI